MSVMQEFKAFAVKGNVIDLAVGVIIGAAFGAIVKSLTDEIIKRAETAGWVVLSRSAAAEKVPSRSIQSSVSR